MFSGQGQKVRAVGARNLCCFSNSTSSVQHIKSKMIFFTDWASVDVLRMWVKLILNQSVIKIWSFKISVLSTFGHDLTRQWGLAHWFFSSVFVVVFQPLFLLLLGVFLSTVSQNNTIFSMLHVEISLTWSVQINGCVLSFMGGNGLQAEKKHLIIRDKNYRIMFQKRIAALW